MSRAAVSFVFRAVCAETIMALDPWAVALIVVLLVLIVIPAAASLYEWYRLVHRLGKAGCCCKDAQNFYVATNPAQCIPGTVYTTAPCSACGKA